MITIARICEYVTLY